MTKRIIFGVLSLIIMAAIFFMSAQSGGISANISGDVTDAILARSDDYIALDNEQKSEVQESVGHILRKIAHACEYFALSASLCLFLFTFKGHVGALSSLAALIAFVYACSDELHQTFVPGRSGELADVLIDLAGACLAALLFGAVCSSSRKIRAKKEAKRAEALAWLAS